MNWRTARWAIVDCETTGTETARDRIVDLGVVIVAGGVIIDRHGWLVNPGVPIPAEASAVHGITDATVRDERPFADVAFDFVQATQGSIPVAYNAPFDRAILLAEFLRAGFADPPALLRSDAQWIDPLVWARVLCRGGSRKLGDIARRLGVQQGEAHRATGDCETTARVLVAIADRLPTNLARLVLEQRRHEAVREAAFVKQQIDQEEQTEMNHPTGWHAAKVTAWALKDETEQFEIAFATEHGTIRMWLGFTSDKQRAFSEKTMKACGWGGDWDRLDLDTETGVRLLVENENYNGKDRIKVKAVSRGGAQGGAPVTSAKGRSFIDRMKGRAATGDAFAGAPAWDGTGADPNDASEPPPF